MDLKYFRLLIMCLRTPSVRSHTHGSCYHGNSNKCRDSNTRTGCPRRSHCPFFHDDDHPALSKVFVKQKTVEPSRMDDVFKTRLCRDFRRDGQCPREEKCPFAHGETELRRRPLNPNNRPIKVHLCTVFAKTGTCPFGSSCTFAHGEADRAQHLAKCNSTVPEPVWATQDGPSCFTKQLMCKYGRRDDCRALELYGASCWFRHSDDP
jgi:butyrate response factor 1